MTCTPSNRWLLSFALAGAFTGANAQTLPAAVPTRASQAVGAQPALLVQPAPVESGPRRARVQFHNGVLAVMADNSSLNQILRDVADRSGMTITGGVTDERVYGTYGPADVGSILNQLLEGTGSNVLLLETANNRPRELVLTPRGGGPTPPSPPALSVEDRRHDRDDDDDRPPQAEHRFARKPPAPAGPAPVAQAPTTPAAALDPGTTTQQSPNGTKTPQQIYEQLLQMQQKKTPQ